MGRDLMDGVEGLRDEASRRLRLQRKPEWGQFLTPAPVARLLASHVLGSPCVRILDAGAGIGSLSAATVAELCARPTPPAAIQVTAYEIDPQLAAQLPATYELCRSHCKAAGVRFAAEVIESDFLAAAAAEAGSLFGATGRRFNCAVLNPPYAKLRGDSEARRHLRAIGSDSSNAYTGFLSAATQLLDADGELVAITPRSFCNGAYFRRFRRAFLGQMRIRTLHVFESRRTAFREDAVLQENVILRAVKAGRPRADAPVTIVCSSGPDDADTLSREVPYGQVVRPDDPQAFIRIAADGNADRVTDRLAGFATILDELGLRVSTGRVVDFRVRSHLRDAPCAGAVPLIWPGHFAGGRVVWPAAKLRKPQAIAADAAVQSQLVPNEYYVLVRRFSAKEERRRVTAAVHEPDRIPAKEVGFENHLNFYHRGGRGLDPELARGLAVYLNSTLVDEAFRQFSGHTQVNATDLRSLRYPRADQLRRLGALIGAEYPGQTEVDALLAQELRMSDEAHGPDPVRVKTRIDEAVEVLRSLGFPRKQFNERSALSLLALLNLRPDAAWSEADEPLRGITPIMEFMRDEYGKSYKPNTRETVRKDTVQYFVEAGLVVANPDEPGRAVNSPKSVYRIETSALKLLRTYGTSEWDSDLQAYLSSVQTLRQKYSQQREMARIPISLAPGREITLSPGGQNVLVKQIIDEFAPRFTSPGRYIYVGDTDTKFAHFDQHALSELGVTVDEHGKMPDVIIHYTERDWLVLVEAVTSHGPIDAKRKDELARLFRGCRIGLVYVTAFLDRRAMVSYLGRISWETEVWVAESPGHMIHFNGKRFLGPYEA